MCINKIVMLSKMFSKKIPKSLFPSYPFNAYTVYSDAALKVQLDRSVGVCVHFSI